MKTPLLKGEIPFPMSGSPSYSYAMLSLLLGFHLLRLRFSNLEKFSLCGSGGGSIIQTHPVLLSPGHTEQFNPS